MILVLQLPVKNISKIAPLKIPFIFKPQVKRSLYKDIETNNIKENLEFLSIVIIL